jgi:hypothetical protein
VRQLHLAGSVRGNNKQIVRPGSIRDKRDVSTIGRNDRQAGIDYRPGRSNWLGVLRQDKV